jgi:nicotinamidase-related amidase
MLTAFAAYLKACKATAQRESGGTNRDRQALTKQQASLVIDASRAALLIIDVQKAIDAAYHAADGARNNPGAESNIARLLSIWRGNERPIIHIRHDSIFPASAFRPGQEGNQFKDEVAPRPGEKIFPKRTNSAFIGTDLERYLRDAGLETLVVTGVSTNNSVEATVRMSGNLGFRTYLVEDACFTFGRRDFSGRLRTAEEVHAMSLGNLHGEYCTVINTAALLAN